MKRGGRMLREGKELGGRTTTRSVKFSKVLNLTAGGERRRLSREGPYGEGGSEKKESH